MQIVIDKESLIALFTVAFYAICGGDYSDVKNTVIELLDKVSYTSLPKRHGRLIDADYLREDFKASKRISFAERMDISCIIDHAPTIIEADIESEDSNERERLGKVWNKS